MAAALSSFRDYYHDATRDEYKNIYAPLMEEFAIPNGQNPAALRDFSTNNPEMTSVGYHSLPGSPQPSGPWLLSRHSQPRYSEAGVIQDIPPQDNDDAL